MWQKFLTNLDTKWSKNYDQYNYKNEENTNMISISKDYEASFYGNDPLQMVSSKKDSKCKNEIHPTNEHILAFLFFPLIIVAIA